MSHRTTVQRDYPNHYASAAAGQINRRQAQDLRRRLTNPTQYPPPPPWLNPQGASVPTPYPRLPLSPCFPHTPNCPFPPSLPFYPLQPPPCLLPRPYPILLPVPDPKRPSGVPFTKANAREMYERSRASRARNLAARRKPPTPPERPCATDLLWEQINGCRRSLATRIGPAARAALLHELVALLGRLDKAQAREREERGEAPRGKATASRQVEPLGGALPDEDPPAKPTPDDMTLPDPLDALPLLPPKPTAQ